MKSIGVFLLVMALQVGAWAVEKGQVHTQLGVGMDGSKDVLGVSVDYFAWDNFSFYGALSLGLNGAGKTILGKFHSSSFHKTGTFWDNCLLFLLKCDKFAYVGFGAQHFGRVETIFDAGGQERSYEAGPAWYGMATIGTYSVFPSNITFDLELAYKVLVSRENSRHLSGPELESDWDTVRRPKGALGINVSMGYLF